VVDLVAEVVSRQMTSKKTKRIAILLLIQVPHLGKLNWMYNAELHFIAVVSSRKQGT
jgi:hypothetical protein